MRDHEQTVRENWRSTTSATLVALSAVAFLLSSRSSDIYGSYEATATTSIDLIKAADQPLSPLTHTKLIARDTTAEVLLHGCSDVADGIDERSTNILARTALAQPNGKLHSVSFTDTRYAAKIVRCKTAQVHLPDSILARVELPITYQLGSFLQRSTDPLGAKPMNPLVLGFNKAPGTVCTYSMKTRPVQTLWQVVNAAFVPVEHDDR